MRAAEALSRSAASQPLRRQYGRKFWRMYWIE